VSALILILSVLGGLEIFVRVGLLSSNLVPSPSSVFLAVVADGAYFRAAFLETVFCSLVGFVIAVIAASVMGFWVGHSPKRTQAVLPLALFGQTVPVIALAPILVVYFGFGYPSVVAASVLVAFFPILASAIEGVRSTPKDLMELFEVAGVRGWARFRQLVFPAALPFLFQGIRIAAGLSVVGAVVGEFISGTGLGSVMDAGRVQYKMDQLFGAVVLSALWAWVLVRILDQLFPKRYRFRLGS
jgi:NitT/TauT family transport system permease protein